MANWNPTESEPHWSRRRLLTTTALAAGAAITANAAPSRDDVRKRFGGYPMGLHGASIAAFSIKKAVRMVAADLGLHWMEITAAQIRIQTLTGARDPGPAAPIDEIRKLRALLDKSDITATAFGPIRLTDDADENRGIFNRAKALGVRNLTCIPQPAALDGLEALADEFSIRLAIHNNSGTSPFNKIADVITAIEKRGPNVGACLDIGNAIRGSEDPAEAVRRLGARLMGVHLKDVSARDPDSEVIVLGKGFLDVPEFFAALAEVGFPDDGALSLEYLENPKNPLPGIREGLKIAAEAVNSR